MDAQAVMLIGPGKVGLREVSVPEPRAGEVQVRSLANGICMGEVVQFAGVLQLPYPRPLGHEGIGVVSQIGTGVERLREGDYVTIWNDPRRGAKDGFPWQTVLNLPADRAVRFSAAPDDPAVMLGEPAACIATALYTYDICPGDRVLVLGAGYMGLLNVQALAHCPLAELIVTDLKPGNLDLAERFGATRTIRAGTPKGEAALEALAAEPFDLVVEAAGAEAVLQAAADYVRPGGRLSMFAWHHGSCSVNMDAWHMKGITVVNSSPWSGADHNVDKMVRGVRLLERGILDMGPLVTHRHAYTNAQEAMELAAERPDGYVKGVLTF